MNITIVSMPHTAKCIVKIKKQKIIMGVKKDLHTQVFFLSKINIKLCSLSQLTLYRYFPVVYIGYLFYERESYTKSFSASRATGLVESIKYVLLVLFTHSYSGIRDTQYITIIAHMQGSFLFIIFNSVFNEV